MGTASGLLQYPKGLHDLGDGCHAWLLPDGSWGWSNSGLITGSGTSLMVDTLFDLALTREMLEGIRPITDRHPLGTLVNTHSDGDHFFGNQLLAQRGVEIVASQAAAELMTQDQVTALASVKRQAGAIGEFTTFAGEESLDVGGREVRLIQVGPAHTPGDTLVHVPDARLLYAGDVLFIGGTPVVWAGPTSRWVAACDRILDMDVTTIVPGHGPATDKSGVRPVRDYLQIQERRLQLGPAKGKDGANSLGPMLVTPDEIAHLRSGEGFDLANAAHVNDEQVSAGRWSTIDWGFADIITYASRGTRLSPGDVIGSGTVPTGCLFEHFALDPDHFRGWLQPGDEVRLAVEHLGELRHRITESEPIHPLRSGH